VRYRRLRRTGLEVGEIGHGAPGIGGNQWLDGTDEEESLDLQSSILNLRL
jgi:aryl-alcohol dehydrogenase-like predicted oxidoreductase